MNGKQVLIKKGGEWDWVLSIEDRMGVIASSVVINEASVGELITRLNVASRSGAPWPVFEVKRG